MPAGQDGARRRGPGGQRAGELRVLRHPQLGAARMGPVVELAVRTVVAAVAAVGGLPQVAGSLRSGS